MLAALSSSGWTLLIGSLVLGGFIFAWVADAVLGQFGLGVVLSTLVSIGAGFGGLKGMEWGIQHHYVPYQYQTPEYWAGAAICGATLAIVVLSICKGLLMR